MCCSPLLLICNKLQPKVSLSQRFPLPTPSPIMADTNKRALPSASDWEAHRLRITELRKIFSLREIMDKMEEDHFHGTEATYKKKFREWGLYRNISSATALEAANLKRRREALGKPATEILIRGEPIPEDKIRRHLKRAKVSHQADTNNGLSVAVGNVSSVATSGVSSLGNIVARTPRDAATSPPLDSPSPFDRPRDGFAVEEGASSLTHTAANVQAPDISEGIASSSVTNSNAQQETFQTVGTYAIASVPTFPEEWGHLFQDNSPLDCFFELNDSTMLLESSYSLPPSMTSTNTPQPIHRAVQGGHLKVVKLLLQKQPNCCDVEGEKGIRPLWIAAQQGFADIALALIAAGADVNAQDREYKRCPLHQAAQKGYIEVIRALLTHGAGTEIPDWQNSTALAVACSLGQLAVAQLLLEHDADPDSQIVTSDHNPLFEASRSGHLDIVRLLFRYGAKFDHGEDDRATELWIACQNGHLEIVNLLLERGARFNFKDRKLKRSPLHQACQEGHLAVVQRLVEIGADIDSLGEFDVTPLYLACQQGSYDIAHLLLECGTQLNVADTKHGRYPLHQACQQGHIEIARLLLLKGADPHKGDGSSCSPLQIAANQGHANIVALLLEFGADANVTHVGGWTPLMQASFEGHIDAVKTLLEGGANVNYRRKNGITALWLASQEGQTAVVEYLLGKGADYSLGLEQSHTLPIHKAAANGHLEVMKKLHEAGSPLDSAKVGEDGEAGATAMTLACEGGFDDIVGYLLDHSVSVYM
ncbi:ankyrin repeat-containing domain protein [Schizothecium vesticola]|uniref:Ankyrin repeat-containing domain protein n=1 Tax=Schizothecium vesticola TaxID=314040 RepID=A0AA40EHQ8_9PEZI|nr:ankyrin repeat-containing domain protein [Schizothecium vesticola]